MMQGNELTTSRPRTRRCPVAELSALPAGWLRVCLARLGARGQCRDDIIRRSSGLPFALGALFVAEPYNTPKSLLPRAMAVFLELADAAGTGPAPAPRPEWRLRGLPLLPEPLRGAAEAGPGAAGGLAALLDEEPWAAVHAFNCLRHTFNDSNLAVDTSGFFAEGIQVRAGA
jgi:hypothetical protein